MSPLRSTGFTSLGIADSGIASGRGDRRWLEGTLSHVQRLSDRRIKLCPQYDKPSMPERVGLWFKQAGYVAGKAFLRYITLGTY